MKAAIFAYSRKGCETAMRAADALHDYEVVFFAPERVCTEPFQVLSKPTAPVYGALFGEMDAMIFVGSCGIAVRAIAPHVRSKKTDPAVICMDELGRFSISLLAGHIGGANALARTIAETIGATAVITTATDINGKFSVDAWAARNGYMIDSMKKAKQVSAAILEQDIPMHTQFAVTSELPGGIYAGTDGPIGIEIGWSTEDRFDNTLHLIPKNVYLGIGCRRDTPKEKIRIAVETALRDHGIDSRAVVGVASVDLKADEQGLLEFCGENGWPVQFYTAEELNAVPGEFTASSFVRQITGVDNVCERAALCGADRLIMKKTALDGVTVAAAEKKWEITFE